MSAHKPQLMLTLNTCFVEMRRAEWIMVGEIYMTMQDLSHRLLSVDYQLLPLHTISRIDDAPHLDTLTHHHVFIQDTSLCVT